MEAALLWGAFGRCSDRYPATLGASWATSHLAPGAKAVCGHGASVQAISVNQIAQVPNPASRPTTLIGRPPKCKYILYYNIIISSTGIVHWHLKKSPAECGAGVKGARVGLSRPLFGRFSFETNVFGGSASLFSSADYCERGKCVPAVFGVGVAPDEEPGSGSSSSARESTSGRSTNYGRGHLIRVFRDIGRIVS